jgi:hypothetical protein
MILSLMTIVMAVSIFFLAALHVVAYSKREDKTFFGGWNILNGLFLIFPYGKGGVSRNEHRLVFWCRVSAVLTVASMGFVYYLRAN